MTEQLDWVHIESLIHSISIEEPMFTPGSREQWGAGGLGLLNGYEARRLRPLSTNLAVFVRHCCSHLYLTKELVESDRGLRKTYIRL
jgi:hypothetical protein